MSIYCRFSFNVLKQTREMCEQVVKIADFCQALHLTEGRISILHTSVKIADFCQALHLT